MIKLKKKTGKINKVAKIIIKCASYKEFSSVVIQAIGVRRNDGKLYIYIYVCVCVCVRVCVRAYVREEIVKIFAIPPVSKILYNRKTQLLHFTCLKDIMKRQN